MVEDVASTQIAPSAPRTAASAPSGQPVPSTAASAPTVARPESSQVEQAIASPDRSAALWVVAGAGCISASAMFIKLAGVDAPTSAFLRCALALAVLVPLAGFEVRRCGRLEAGAVWSALVAGIFLGLDFQMWTVSIFAVGAGIASVLVNIQVIVFPLLARVFGGTPISRRFLLVTPIMLVGVALAGGVLDAGPAGRDPVRGTLFAVAAGVAYAGFLYLSRRSGERSPAHLATPTCLATSSGAGTVAAVAPFTGGIHLPSAPAAWGWLAALAVLCQAVAWTLVARGSSRLAPNTAAALLLLQPVLAVGFGLLVLGERPSVGQLIGCAVVTGAVWLGAQR